MRWNELHLTRHLKYPCHPGTDTRRNHPVADEGHTESLDRTGQGCETGAG